jgi:ribosome-associated heat shock protein Hsp15
MVRIDKYLWAIRVYKTRSDAAEACRTGRVTVNGSEAKASREVHENDIITVRKPPVTYTYRVIQLLENRRSAKEVPFYAENRTPAEELSRLDPKNSAATVWRERGAGRPTKKDRRDLDKWFHPSD